MRADEIREMGDEDIRSRLAAHKLPLKTRFVKREEGE